MKEIEGILDFIVEVEKLKSVTRKTKPIGLERYENSAEHSWHVSLLALLLKDYANENIDIDKVIRMLLIHDLGEIDGGDKIIYSSEIDEQKEIEAKGLRRLLSSLEDEKAAEYFDLWIEFEAGKTPESKYAKSIDRIPPLLHNIHGNGHSWKENSVSSEKVFEVNSRIEKGSSPV
ncbi:MAG: HD domain-containing protein [Verrucomicrobiota bacterium]